MVFDRHWLAITRISFRGGPASNRFDRRAPSPPTEYALLTGSRLMVLGVTALHGASQERSWHRHSALPIGPTESLATNSLA